MNFFQNQYHSERTGEYIQKNGISRYLEVFWDHLGSLLLINLICFVAFLPLAMGITLGLTLQNFWITIFCGTLGGILFYPVWIISLNSVLCFHCNITVSWFSLFKKRIPQIWKTTVTEGASFGFLSGSLLTAGSLFIELSTQGVLPLPIVWMSLCLDFFILAIVITILSLPLSITVSSTSQRLQEGRHLLFSNSKRILGASLGFLLCFLLIAALFPVSIPFCMVIGFWPLLLFMTQLYLPLSNSEHIRKTAIDADSAPSTLKKPFRHWGVLVFVLVALSITLGIIQFYSAYREPDLQIAIVHKEALPDNVLSTLTTSIEQLVGDINGDGYTEVIINDYTVVFDGSATDMDVQSAGMTRLVTDISAKDSCIFITEDPKGFLKSYADFMQTDYLTLWSDTAVFSKLDAGTYETIEDIDNTLTGQELLKNYTVIPSASCIEQVFNYL